MTDYYSQVTYTSGGREFRIPFKRLSETDVGVSVDGVRLSAGDGYTIDSTADLVITKEPVAVGVPVLIQRTTAKTEDALAVKFQDGSYLDAASLNRSTRQNLYHVQELDDQTTARQDAYQRGLDARMSAVETVSKQSSSTVQEYDDRVRVLEARHGFGSATVPISKGGTDASTPGEARQKLGAQQQSATLDSIATLGAGADKVLYTTGAHQWAEAPCTRQARDLLAGRDPVEQRATLGLVTADPILPLSGKGDLLGHDGRQATRIPVGPDGHVLRADASTPTGLGWEDGCAYPFSVWLDRDMVVGYGAKQQIPFTHVECNVGGFFDVNTYSLKPMVAGWYWLVLAAYISGASPGAQVELSINDLKSFAMDGASSNSTIQTSGLFWLGPQTPATCYIRNLSSKAEDRRTVYSRDPSHTRFYGFRLVGCCQ